MQRVMKMRNNGNHAHVLKGSASSIRAKTLPDIKPQTEVATLHIDKYEGSTATFPFEQVATLVGMAPTFIRKICGRKGHLTVQDVLLLLEQDAFRETLVPRSKIIDFLLNASVQPKRVPVLGREAEYALLHEHVLDTLATMPKASVQCVVTSTPYWGLRIYKETRISKWADGKRTSRLTGTSRRQTLSCDTQRKCWLRFTMFWRRKVRQLVERDGFLQYTDPNPQQRGRGSPRHARQG